MQRFAPEGIGEGGDSPHTALKEVELLLAGEDGPLMQWVAPQGSGEDGPLMQWSAAQRLLEGGALPQRAVDSDEAVSALESKIRSFARDLSQNPKLGIGLNDTRALGLLSGEACDAADLKQRLGRLFDSLQRSLAQVASRSQLQEQLRLLQGQLAAWLSEHGPGALRALEGLKATAKRLLHGPQDVAVQQALISQAAEAHPLAHFFGWHERMAAPLASRAEGVARDVLLLSRLTAKADLVSSMTAEESLRLAATAATAESEMRPLVIDVAVEEVGRAKLFGDKEADVLARDLGRAVAGVANDAANDGTPIFNISVQARIGTDGTLIEEAAPGLGGLGPLLSTKPLQFRLPGQDSQDAAAPGSQRLSTQHAERVLEGADLDALRTRLRSLRAWLSKRRAGEALSAAERQALLRLLQEHSEGGVAAELSDFLHSMLYDAGAKLNKRVLSDVWTLDDAVLLAELLSDDGVEEKLVSWLRAKESKPVEALQTLMGNAEIEREVSTDDEGAEEVREPTLLEVSSSV